MRDQPAHLVFDFVFSELVDQTHRTEDEADAEEKLMLMFSDLEWSRDTGLPTAARRFSAADGSVVAEEDSPFNVDTSEFPPGFV